MFRIDSLGPMIRSRLKFFLHVGFWAYMFLSPMQFIRGTGMTIPEYAMNCMGQLLMMAMFYINYLWLTQRYFVSGKHRYFLMINTVLVVLFVTFLHYWGNYTNLIFQSNARLIRQPDTIDELFFYVRDFVNLSVFATVGTCIALASRWFWADDARKLAETARVKAETAQVKAELNSLRSQINPHFLLNTLNNIYALTAFDQQRAQDAVMQLSKMLRHMLYDSQQEEVKLSDEVKFLENYVNLMKIRLPQTVDVQFHTELCDPDKRVATLLFISLVENAFKHGISPTKPSFVHINMKQPEENLLIVTIENSNYPKAEDDRSGHGVGLQQVQRRLDLAYSQRYEWTTDVSDDGKTYLSTIKIKL